MSLREGEAGAMGEEMEARIRQLVAEHLGVSIDDLTPEVSLTDDLAADSLDLFALSVVLEEDLGVNVPESALEHARTYGEVVAVTMAALARVRRPKSGAAGRGAAGTKAAAPAARGRRRVA